MPAFSSFFVVIVFLRELTWNVRSEIARSETRNYISRMRGPRHASFQTGEACTKSLHRARRSDRAIALVVTWKETRSCGREEWKGVYVVIAWEGYFWTWPIWLNLGHVEVTSLGSAHSIENKTPKIPAYLAFRPLFIPGLDADDAAGLTPLQCAHTHFTRMSLSPSEKAGC
ncbi:hypothetical protein BC936DRAFT_148114 [Jimgerdemannia flammicorona]|uniref:Secreted protein n=1 Tax=Jimgerdemannia flammicorona TaxID=994334 RepID=A0A433D3S8_9FUNG|nr:hypothetical protein BC936DRAFT_148114 [Jimgerdemannia flammicorona]